MSRPTEAVCGEVLGPPVPYARVISLRQAKRHKETMRMSETQYDVGLVGLAVMGENLALNMLEKGFSVAVHNRTSDRIDAFLGQLGFGKPSGIDLRGEKSGLLPSQDWKRRTFNGTPPVGPISAPMVCRCVLCITSCLILEHSL